MPNKKAKARKQLRKKKNSDIKKRKRQLKLQKKNLKDTLNKNMGV